ncbi:hypothetical protein JIN77_09590 [Verrucomicrobiaceae bacterium R5-34]|nr:hypothetical protein [Verrucomicrobiaceae bacterium R5-34]
MPKQIGLLLGIDPSDFAELEAAALTHHQVLEAEREGIREALNRDEWNFSLSYTDYDRRIEREADAVSWSLLVTGVRHDELTGVIKSAIRPCLPWFNDPQMAEFYVSSNPGWLIEMLDLAAENARYYYASVAQGLFPYVRTGVYPRPLTGHPYYLQLPLHMQSHFQLGSGELAAFLLEDVEFVEHDLPESVRLSNRGSEVYAPWAGFAWRAHISNYLLQVDDCHHTELARYDAEALSEPWGKNKSPAPEWVNPSKEAELYWQNGKLPRPDAWVPSELTLALRHLSAEGSINLKPFLTELLGTIASETKEFYSRDLRRAFELITDGASGAILPYFDDLLTLLANPFPPVVRFSLEQIDKIIVVLGPDDLKSIADEIVPVFTHVKSKPLLVFAIGVLCRLCDAMPDQREHLIEMVAPLLQLKAANVQKAVLKMLGEKPDKGDELLRLRISAFENSILGSLKEKFKPWTEDKIVSNEVVNVIERVDFPIGEPVKPQKGIDDVVYAANELLSAKAPDSIRLELFLDGLARIDRSDRQTLIDAFLVFEKRAEKLCADPWQHCPVRVFIAQTIIAVRGVQNSGWHSTLEGDHIVGTMRFLRCRVKEILEIFLEGKARSLIGRPSTGLGFVSFSDLELRVRAIIADGHEVGFTDMVQGLARWDGRDAKLSKPVKPDDPEALRVISFLVDGVLLGCVETVEWWITAARMRDPMCSLAEIAGLAELLPLSVPEWSNFCDFSRLSSYDNGTYPDPADPAPLVDNDGVYFRDCKDACLLELISMPFARSEELRNPSMVNWTLSAVPGYLNLFLFQNVGAVTVQALADRRLQIGVGYARHMVYLLAAEDRVQREGAPELWLIAEQDGQMDAAMSHLRLVLGVGLNSAFDFAFPMRRVVPSLRAVADLDARLRPRVRDLILGALEDGVLQDSEVLQKINPLIKLALDLSLEVPTSLSFDFTKLESVSLPKAAEVTLKKLKQQLV